MGAINGHHGLMMASAGGASVSYVSASGPSYIATGTTIATTATPAAIQNADGLFAIVYTRSALTPPAGWTLVRSQLIAASGVTQTLYVYRKDTATTADSSTSPTWTQAASGRMGIAYVTARSTSGVITVAASADTTTAYAAGTANPHNVTVSGLTSSGAETFLIAATTIFATTTPGGNTWTPATGATLRTSTSIGEDRLAAFTQSRTSGQANASPAVFNAGAAGEGAYVAITVRLQP